MATPPAHARRISYLGPRGTFSEQALKSESDLAGEELVPYETIGGAISAVSEGEVDAAFVPIENSIEGSVSATMDKLIFGDDLFIQREMVLEVHLELLALPGARLGDLRKVISYPHASAQSRTFLAEHLPGVEVGTTNSTADAARIVSESGDISLGAIAPAITAEIYELSVLAHAIEDHDGNETRFVLVAPDVVPPPSGHDRTTIVCFQHADRPGSLLQILGQFAARNLNLTRIESRPTKRALGDYCFIIEFEGHVGDEIVGDALAELHLGLEAVKFIGSYPVTGEVGASRRDEQLAIRKTADDWLVSLRDRIQ